MHRRMMVAGFCYLLNAPRHHFHVHRFFLAQINLLVSTEPTKLYISFLKMPYSDVSGDDNRNPLLPTELQ